MSQFVGQIILTANGLPQIQCKSLRATTETGRQILKGMSPTGLPIGKTGGTRKHTMSVEVYIPSTGDLAWDEVPDWVLLFVPRDGGVPVTYWGGITTRVGSSFQEEGAATRTIDFEFMGKI